MASEPTAAESVAVRYVAAADTMVAAEFKGVAPCADPTACGAGGRIVVDAAVVRTKVVKHLATVRWKARAAPEAADVAVNAKSSSTTLRPSLVSNEESGLRG